MACCPASEKLRSLSTQYGQTWEKAGKWNSSTSTLLFPASLTLALMTRINLRNPLGWLAYCGGEFQIIYSWKLASMAPNIVRIAPNGRNINRSHTIQGMGPCDRPSEGQLGPQVYERKERSRDRQGRLGAWHGRLVVPVGNKHALRNKHLGTCAFVPLRFY